MPPRNCSPRSSVSVPPVSQVTLILSIALRFVPRFLRRRTTLLLRKRHVVPASSKRARLPTHAPACHFLCRYSQAPYVMPSILGAPWMRAATPEATGRTHYHVLTHRPAPRRRVHRRARALSGTARSVYHHGLEQAPTQTPSQNSPIATQQSRCSFSNEAVPGSAARY